MPKYRRVYKKHNTFLKSGTYLIRFISQNADFPNIEISLAKYYTIVNLLQFPNRFSTQASIIEIETGLDQDKLFYKKFIKYFRTKKFLVICQQSVYIGNDDKSLIDSYEAIDISFNDFLKIA